MKKYISFIINNCLHKKNEKAIDRLEDHGS